jgi:predicted transcriptional regulator
MSIVYKANLNFIRIGKYLDILIATGMIEAIRVNESVLYSITDRGREFLLNYRKLKESLRIPEVSNVPNTLLA